MTGYREHDDAPPAPLTWVQRAGVACLFLGAAIVLVYIAGRIGLVPKLLNSPVPGTAVVAVAAPLIGVRRRPLSAETKRQRLHIILAAIALCAIVAVLTFMFKGA